MMNRRHSLVTLLVILVVCPSLGACATGEVARIVRFEKACDEGKGGGCADVADMYAHGDGVPKDAARAARYYQLACNDGNQRGCVGLGNAYATGEGIAKDTARARQLLEQACSKKNARGCVALGEMYEKGNGVPRNASRRCRALSARLRRRQC